MATQNETPPIRPRPPRFFLGRHSYASRAAVRIRCQEVIKSYADEAIIVGDDHEFLKALIARHPEAGQKIGAGIAYFTVQHDPVWGTSRHFVLVRQDMSRTDFSYMTCVAGKVNPAKDFKEALRRAIAGQVQEFARDFLQGAPKVCIFTGAPSKIGTCHVDHIPPNTFQVLVQRWRSAEPFPEDRLGLVPSVDNQWARDLADPEVLASWQDFHRREAKLRVISPSANLKKLPQ